MNELGFFKGEGLDVKIELVPMLLTRLAADAMLDAAIGRLRHRRRHGSPRALTAGCAC